VVEVVEELQVVKIRVVGDLANLHRMGMYIETNVGPFQRNQGLGQEPEIVMIVGLPSGDDGQFFKIDERWEIVMHDETVGDTVS